MSLTEFDQEAHDRRRFREGVEKGILQGKEEGIFEGAQKKAMETAKTMLHDKVPIESIIKYTGLSKSDISKIAENEIT